jgi:hypothetical protein
MWRAGADGSVTRGEHGAAGARSTSTTERRAATQRVPGSVAIGGLVIPRRNPDEAVIHIVRIKVASRDRPPLIEA